MGLSIAEVKEVKEIISREVKSIITEFTQQDNKTPDLYVDQSLELLEYVKAKEEFENELKKLITFQTDYNNSNRHNYYTVQISVPDVYMIDMGKKSLALIKYKMHNLIDQQFKQQFNVD